MKTVLVTGSSSGIGLATATHFAQKKYRVVATARTPDKSESLQQLAQKYPNVSLKSLDVCSQESVDSVIDETRHKIGEVQILINNAGISGSGSLEHAPIERARDHGNQLLWSAQNDAGCVACNARSSHWQYREYFLAIW